MNEKTQLNTHCSSKSADRMGIQRKNQHIMPSRHSNHCSIFDFEANKEIILTNDLCQMAFLKSTQLGFPECNFLSSTYSTHITISTNSEWEKKIIQSATTQPHSHHQCLIHFKFWLVGLLNQHGPDNPSQCQTRIVLSYPCTVYRPMV